MSDARLPTFFLSHGGGPWPYIDEMKQQFARTAEEFARIPQSLPSRPEAVLMVSGHWEAGQFSVATAAHPPTEYDYYGFPEHTYRIRYPAPGAPQLANRVRELMAGAGIPSGEDPQRGFDHGVFVPMVLMYPDADMPVLKLSMKSNYDPREHIRLGEALQPLRDEGVLIMGSGLTYHNMRGFRQPGSDAVSEQFEAWLNDTISQPAPVRNERLANWQQAPAARLAHPREDHLIPLMVVAGAAGQDTGRRVFVDKVWNVVMASYRFG
jgi:aromatic ring-opening dioxygenase catalytic subunit (LigB family)